MWAFHPASAEGHALRAQILPGEGSVEVVCTYGAGLPASAEVRLVSPADPTRYRQILQTDEEGTARFRPDTPGLWRLVVDDGLGHRAELEFEVGEGGSVRVVGGPLSGDGPRWIFAALAGSALAWIGWHRWGRRRALG